ncbi:hypothetical protein ABT144_05660 [Streptomyces sp. NPDC002039]|uniref:hypothetical protein n=1 Tax=Streptomyces sp. NPDC002039 TaxID=3154660 RepID=UPI00333491B2
MNDAARYGYHGFGGLITQFPVIGDPAQRMIDAATYAWSKDVAAEHEAMALKKESTDAAAGVRATNSLIDSFATGQGARGSVAHEHARPSRVTPPAARTRTPRSARGSRTR